MLELLPESVGTWPAWEADDGTLLLLVLVARKDCPEKCSLQAVHHHVVVHHLQKHQLGC